MLTESKLLRDIFPDNKNSILPAQVYPSELSSCDNLESKEDCQIRDRRPAYSIPERF